MSAVCRDGVVSPPRHTAPDDLAAGAEYRLDLTTARVRTTGGFRRAGTARTGPARGLPRPPPARDNPPAASGSSVRSR